VRAASHKGVVPQTRPKTRMSYAVHMQMTSIDARASDESETFLREQAKRALPSRPCPSAG